MTKFVGEQPLANADIAARKLVEIANGIEAAQEGRIYQCTVLEGRRHTGSIPCGC